MIFYTIPKNTQIFPLISTNYKNYLRYTDTTRTERYLYTKTLNKIINKPVGTYGILGWNDIKDVIFLKDDYTIDLDACTYFYSGDSATIALLHRFPREKNIVDIDLQMVYHGFYLDSNGIPIPRSSNNPTRVYIPLGERMFRDAIKLNDMYNLHISDHL